MSQPPIRRALLLTAVSTCFLWAGTARAATVTIDFDDPGRVRNEIITDQYGTLGVTFSGDDAKIKTGPGFNNPFDSDGNILHITGSNPQDAVLEFASPTRLLSFEFRRPSNAGQIFLTLFDDDGLVFDAGEIGWDPAVTPDWVTFAYTGDSGPVTRAEFSAPTKFVIDNLSFEGPNPQPIPLPLPAVLFATGLVPLLGYRRQR